MPTEPEDHATKLGPFEFKGNDGKTYKIPAFKGIKSGVLRRARRAKDPNDRMYTILEEVCAGTDGQAALGALDDFDGAELEAFMRAWMEHSGVDVASLGESSSSSA